MRLVDDRFKEFLGFLKTSEMLSKESLEKSLLEFGGAEGVIASSYYISAYEALGGSLARENTLESILSFFSGFEIELGEDPELNYYFVESIVDNFLALGGSVGKLIEAAPMNYRVFLRKRFLSG